jgi:chitinase
VNNSFGTALMLVAGSFCCGLAQTISGTVSDTASGAKLSGVTVEVKDATQRTVSDAQGAFALSLTTGVLSSPVAVPAAGAEPAPMVCGITGKKIATVGDSRRLSAGICFVNYGAGKQLFLTVGQTRMPARRTNSAMGGGGGSAMGKNALPNAGVVTLVCSKTGYYTKEAAASWGDSGIIVKMKARLPDKLVGGYWQRWEGPNVSEITTNAPEYNLQYGAVAQSAQSGTGKVSFFPDFSGASRFKTDMAASKAIGCTWLLTVGGGGDGGIVLTNETQVSEMVSSVETIVDEYGFDGVDWDLESGTSGWNTASLTSASQQLKAHYGQNFIISAAPRPYEDIYRDWAVSMGSTLDLFGYQFYDAPDYNDSAFLHDNIFQRVTQSVNMGIPASKILVGCITYDGYSGGHNTDEVYRSIFLDLLSKYPDLRGAFVWETHLDKLNAWGFAKVVGRAVRNLP